MSSFSMSYKNGLLLLAMGYINFIETVTFYPVLRYMLMLWVILY